MISWNPDAIPEYLDITLVSGGLVITMSECDFAVLSADAKIIIERTLPEQVTLFNAAPNPFNPVTEIRFALPEKANIDLSVYDLMGRKISALANGEFNTGVHSVMWDGTDVSGMEMPTGVYFYRIVVGETGENITKSMVLLK